MSKAPVNQTEAFVLDLCRRSALSLWCYNNPRGKQAGKELCDVLVVHDPHVIIISVKEVELKESDNPSLDLQRWERKAVTDSVKQIYGAERWLSTASRVIRCDGTDGQSLPAMSERITHRIAVAFGSHDRAPIQSSNSDKGFVHVMNERSFSEILNELDTITDLVDYLTATERFAAQNKAIVISGSESNLLGLYLHNNRSFPQGADMMIVEDDIWDSIREKPEFKKRKNDDRVSYHWDHLIELLADPRAKSIAGSGPDLTNVEMVLRTMSRETRFARRALGLGVYEFFEDAKAKKTRSRIMVFISGIIYVFVYFAAGEDSALRAAELGCRCLIARHTMKAGDTVIGIGVSKHVENYGSTSDLIYLHFPCWSHADDERAVLMKADLGFFASAQAKHSSYEEYPSTD